jgi:hypothetical protein
MLWDDAMDLTPPADVVSVLQDLGFQFPEANQITMLRIGQAWTGFADRARQPLQDAQDAAERVWTANLGKAIDAFEQAWSQSRGAHANLMNAATGGEGIGIGLMVCAAIVLALKINEIVNGTTLLIETASAVAEALPSLGTSLLEIPVFKEITGKLINLAISLAMNAVMGH